MSASDLVDDVDDVEVPEADRLRGELETLREENERLRAEYARAKQSQYRRSAATLAAIGVLALLAGVVVADARTVLFALGGTGVFLGVLTYFLTPERFISASVGEAVYASFAENESKAIAELGLESEWVYVPRTDSDRETSAKSVTDVRLFVPQHAEYDVPADDELSNRFVVADNGRRRGIALQPTAADLYTAFEQAVTGEPDEDPAAVMAQLGDALVEQFELVGSVDSEVDSAAGHASVRVDGSALGRLDRVDHPVTSLLGVGLATVSGRSVSVEVAPADDAGTEYVVSCSWPVEDGGDAV
ncbi:hypothetical protein [Halosimplex salinum]|uniref:hypothetical protein n=1 Tax=Halosimplex salinum TaxID=1710538 RepID=UPI000F4ABF39|nr:hypothetical protein [Halosimplex salinum]